MVEGIQNVTSTYRITKDANYPIFAARKKKIVNWAYAYSSTYFLFKILPYLYSYLFFTINR